MQSNSNAIIQNNTLTKNLMYEAVYSLTMSTIQLYNVAFYENRLMVPLLQMQLNSSATIQNNTLTKNKLGTVYLLFSRSNIQMNNVAFTGNLIIALLIMRSNSSAIIQNNTLTENHVSEIVYLLFNMSNILMKNVAFTRNLIHFLLRMESNSSAIIQDNTLTKNNVSGVVYVLIMSTIQLYNVAFYRNELFQNLLQMRSNSSATIQNNTLAENHVSGIVYLLYYMSNIQMNNVAFTRNNLMQFLMIMYFNCSAIIQNNTLTENNLTVALLHMKSMSSATVKKTTIVGNSLKGRVFDVVSSNLIIDTTLLYNNIFMNYLISAISCYNISIDLTRITENRFESNIIHIENSTGRLTNTYIENYDRFSVSAMSVTCRYEGHRHCPFYIRNNVILWNSESLLSKRSVIELTGTITISNLTVLVSSKLEIDVFRYSKKDVIVHEPFYKAFFNVYEISSLLINCTRANVKHIKLFETFRCTPCLRGTYTLNNGSLAISSRNLENKKREFQNDSTPLSCFDCPVGGNCSYYIKSKSNFYGFKTKQQEVKFLSCLLNYCCTGDQCKTITSCNKGRFGTLCSICNRNNTENFLSTNCISVSSCQNFTKFWLIYFVYALSLATCLYYIKDLIVLMKNAGGKVSNFFKCFRKEKRNEGEIDEIIIIGSEDHPEENVSHFTMSGVFALIVSFYQIKQVMAVDVKYMSASHFPFIKFMSKFLNLEIIAINSSYYCPMNDLNAVSKAFIKTYLFTVALILASLLNYFISRIYYYFGGKLGRRSSLKPSDRLGVCLLRVLMLDYKNMANVSFILLNCVEVEDNLVLHVKGDTECFNWWQVAVAVFFFTWILFFPFSLKLSYTMFMKDEITFPQFIFCLIAPFAVVVYKFVNRNVVSVVLQESRDVSKVKTILQEMFEESYRLKKKDSRGESIFYETWRLYQRVLLSIVSTYFINPLVRITFTTPIIILIAVSYFAVKPHKPEMYILHWMEIVSILGFFVSLIQNIFRGFLYVYSINQEYPVTLAWEAFSIFDLLFHPTWVLLFVFIIKPIYSKVKDAARICKMKMKKL